MRAMQTLLWRVLLLCSAVALIAACSIILVACSSKTDQAPTTQPAAQTPDPALAEQARPVPAPAVTQASWAPDALEELLAPIALYPDQLLGQVLAASVNSQEVMDGGNWLLQNQSLSGDALDKAAQQAGFGPAMRALLQFPTVVDMMCQQIDWTRQLGSAFTSDQKSVLDAVQRLRAQASKAGNLKSTPQQKVETRTENNKVVVEVKPADPKVVYVPQYDPQVAYTAPPPAPSTTATQQSGVSTGAAIATGVIAFGLGVAIGNAFDDDHYYPSWTHGTVYFGPRPFYPPAYVYRPVYGPAFRPAHAYAPPPGYRYNYHNANINVNRNVVVNNNDYYNRFANNQNLRVGSTQSPLVANQRREGQAGNVGATSDWKGRSTYSGQHNTAESERLKQAAGERRSAGSTAAIPQPGGTSSGSTAGTHETPLATRSSTRETNAGARNDRGYGSSTRTQSRDSSTPAQPELPKRDSAFPEAHAQNNGSFERAASARGNASLGARHGSRPHQR